MFPLCVCVSTQVFCRCVCMQVCEVVTQVLLTMGEEDLRQTEHPIHTISLFCLINSSQQFHLYGLGILFLSPIVFSFPHPPPSSTLAFDRCQHLSPCLCLSLTETHNQPHSLLLFILSFLICVL